MLPAAEQLFEFSVVRPLMHTFSTAFGLPMAIVDREGKVLATSHWQRVCTHYHRRAPLSLQRCIESDTDYSLLYRAGRQPVSGDHFETQCRNGLVHIGFPILIEGEYVATLFLSQFFYVHPDLEHFRRQARELGIDEDPYLQAVQEVPVLAPARVAALLGFYSGFARLLERLGTRHLRQLESRRELEKSEEKFRSIFECALDSILLLAPDGRLLEANRQTFANLGYSREELLRLSKFDLHVPEEQERIRAFIDKVMLEGTAFLESVQRRKNGSRLAVEISARRVEMLQEPAILCLTRDITRRKAAEAGRQRALAEAEAAREKVAAILASVPDGLVVTDADDRIVLTNAAAERLLQLSAPLGQPLESLGAPQGLQAQIAASRAEETEQGPFEWEFALGAEEDMRVLQATSMPVRAAAGRLTGVITLLHDLTHEREIDRVKDDFISTAAHELRTPLTTITGFLELLLTENEDVFSSGERREFLQTIYEKSETLAAIIDDLLDLSRIRSGHLITIKKSREDLGVVIGKTVAAYREMTLRHDFAVGLPATPVILPFDAGKIGQVMENLLSNAVKFSPGGGKITIGGHWIDGEFQVTVADEGIGMRPEQAARIFEKFYRANASTTAIGGLGLGMSIVKNIIDAHGGRIWVQSEPGRGTAVHFTLPAE